MKRLAKYLVLPLAFGLVSSWANAHDDDSDSDEDSDAMEYEANLGIGSHGRAITEELAMAPYTQIRCE